MAKQTNHIYQQRPDQLAKILAIGVDYGKEIYRLLDGAGIIGYVNYQIEHGGSHLGFEKDLAALGTELPTSREYIESKKAVMDYIGGIAREKAELIAKLIEQEGASFNHLPPFEFVLLHSWHPVKAITDLTKLLKQREAQEK